MTTLARAFASARVEVDKAGSECHAFRRPSDASQNSRPPQYAMKAAEIREKFLKFFESKGHTIVRSSSLVPGNDPTLLFTNSGMVQFKDVFLGAESRPYSRATTAQRSVRAGGKHNDLENVGYTARHHTFFEMLGNFSFGDYFKRDAIHYCWELLTKVYGLPADKLTVTVYKEDDEAYAIWEKEIGVPAERIIRIGDNKGARYASDNFWQMADTGPCGPCSEVFYDHGPEIWGGPPGSPEEDGDRFIEIWNLVFMQFNRDAQGNMTPLPKQCVDTGMGLERLAAVLQHVHSNYEIDLFQTLIKAAARETDTPDLTNNSLKVIADHIRACSFLIVDGVIPGNEGRGYVLRRIVRRAIRHGYKLGRKGAFFHRLVADLVGEMGAAYPELQEAQPRVTDVLRQEEERFFETIEHGMSILEGELAALEKKGTKQLDGELAFKLHDTYGFPLDLTADVCRERGVTVDEAAFDDAMARQRDQARAAGKFKIAAGLEYSGAKTTFHGYEKEIFDDAKIVALYVEGASVNEVKPGQHAVVVLDHTPFYAESGGQAATRACSRTRACASRCRYAEGAGRRDRPSRLAGAGHAQGRRRREGGDRRDPPRPHGAQPLGDAPDAQGAARGARRPRAAERLARRCRQDPLRLRAQRADDGRTDSPRRGNRQRGSAGERAGHRARDAVRRSGEGRRDGALRREIRRHGARARPRLLARTLRRHARAAHGRHRPLQDRDGRRRRGGHSPRGSDHRRQRRALRAGTRRSASTRRRPC